MGNLITIAENCERIAEELQKKIEKIPKMKTCVHSGFPAMWCDERETRLIYDFCQRNKCGKYEINPKYNT